MAKTRSRGGRGKPLVSIRRPPPVVDEESARVLRGRGRAALPESPLAKGAKALVVRGDGRQLERSTVYLPPELKRRLLVLAASKRSNLSAIVVQICEQHLEGA